MTYQTRESSLQDGEPVELFRFAQGVRKWLYTSGPTSETHQSEVYEPAAIMRGAIDRTTDINRSSIDITMPRDSALAGEFIAAPPEGVISVTVFRRHRGDGDLDTIVIWKGRVSGAKLTGHKLELTCSPISSSLRRPGLRAKYQLMCRHALYDGGCGVLRDSYKTTGTVDAGGGVTIQVNAAASKPNGYFNGGILSAESGQRMIVSHQGQNLKIMSQIPGLAIGENVELYAGCDHSKETCFYKFNNLDNYGGFPFIPTKNPFSGDAIV